jgi:mxaJ protein
MVIRKTAGTGRWLPSSSVLFLVCGLAGAASGEQGEPIRVCANPDGLPNSNQELQGFENKIAEVIARDLDEALLSFHLRAGLSQGPETRPEVPGRPGAQGLKVGAHVGTPPYDALANRDLADNIVTYQLFFDPRDPDPSQRPEKPLLEVLSGAIDAGVAWGPLVGYFANSTTRPSMSFSSTTTPSCPPPSAARSKSTPLHTCS